MRNINDIYLSFYYRLAPLLLDQERIILPPEFSNTKNLFLYFDYEREFSGQSPDITDSDIYSVLNELSEVNIKSTWFVVGQLVSKYKETVLAIKDQGHEIGSHTFQHIPPLSLEKKDLVRDLRSFSDVLRDVQTVKGFHPPMGQWSISLLGLLPEFGFDYVLTGRLRADSNQAYLVKLKDNHRIIRIITMGDDWQLYLSRPDDKTVFNHFLSLYEKISPGDLAGIGFHPWILVSDPSIFKGFISFLNFLSNENNVRILTASQFLDGIT
jgi:peptidoglycan-N-acetylglucosamine deacetylase